MAKITAKKERNMLAEHIMKNPDCHFELFEVKALLMDFEHRIKDSKNGNMAKMNRYVFQDIMHKEFQMTDAYMTDCIFKILDVDNDNFLSREEWVRGMSKYLRGNFLQLIDSCFSCYDTNSDGFISRDEMQRFLKDCLIHQSSEEDQDEQLKELTDLVLKLMDFDKDGRLSYDDYKQAVYKEELLLEVLGAIYPQEECKVTYIEKIKRAYTAANAN